MFEFQDPNNEVMSSRSVNSDTVPGQATIAVCFLWLSLLGECRVTDEALLAETT